MSQIVDDPTRPVRLALPEEPLGLFQSYQRSQRNVLELIPRQAMQEPIISGTSGTRFHMVMEPGATRRILNTRVEDYPKSDVARSVLQPAIGESMLVAEGEDWRRQRKAAAPTFQPRNMDALAPVMQAAAERASQRIRTAGPRAVDMLEEMVTATFEVIGDVTFSGDKGVDRDSALAAMEAYGAAAGKMSILDVLGAPEWVPRPNRMQDAPQLEAMKSLADESIERRRGRCPAGAPDLLDLLMDAEAEGFSQKDIRDNLLAFIIAGHETTALTLAWAFYLLGFDPMAQERAAEEARAVLGERTCTPEDLSSLPFCRAVIDETLRLYPPAAFLSRVALEPDVLCGNQVLAGDRVTIPIYAIHRHSLYWDDPDQFRPERFLDGSPVDRYLYLPFGDGPRICIGVRFALQEAMIVLATLLARFRFAAVPGKIPIPTLVITLRPEGGVWMTVAEREP